MDLLFSDSEEGLKKVIRENESLIMAELSVETLDELKYQRNKVSIHLIHECIEVPHIDVSFDLYKESENIGRYSRLFNFTGEVIDDFLTW